MMKVAIYAWYNSDKKREKSLKGQIGSCMRYAELNGLEAAPDHVYTDTTTSGKLRDRPGLNNLLWAVKAKHFDIVLVDDLSRLPRGNVEMCEVFSELCLHKIFLLTTKDNFDTFDPNSNFECRIRDILRLAYLNDLRLSRLRRANQRMNDMHQREEV